MLSDSPEMHPSLAMKILMQQSMKNLRLPLSLLLHNAVLILALCLAVY